MAEEFVCDAEKKKKQNAKLKSVPGIETLQGAILTKGRPSGLHSPIYFITRTLHVAQGIARMHRQLPQNGTQFSFFATRCLVAREAVVVNYFSALP
jgi:hypothetical protein